ncbi:MAG: histidine kinase [Cyclobacteriaceae bacterium]
MTTRGNTKWRRWMAVFGVLTIIAALAATQLTLRTGSFSFENWSQLFVVQLVIWNVWGMLTPLIFKLSGIISKSKSRRKIILTHIPISIVVVILFLSLYASIFLLFSNTGFEAFAGTLISLNISSFHWYLILYWITVGAEYYLRMQDQYKAQEILNLQLESQLTDAQLKALKMQLNPHFLFNSLNTISGLVRTCEIKKAVGMLARLSDFLREVLIDRGNQEITLINEIGFLKKYLEIEQLRFGNKLEVTFEVEQSVENCLLPSLILQPIVENAIKHGISKKKNARHLAIKAWRKEQQLRISVYNDGPNVSETQGSESLGVGVSNTVKRLEQSYGENCEFTIDNKGLGVEVTIQIPVHHLTEEAIA